MQMADTPTADYGLETLTLIKLKSIKAARETLDHVGFAFLHVTHALTGVIDLKQCPRLNERGKDIAGSSIPR